MMRLFRAADYAAEHCRYDYAREALRDAYVAIMRGYAICAQRDAPRRQD